jgi:UDP-2,4-diacetamido-2,4,6-trideoxy-beta-L-altropyranose hydrolase
LNKKVFFIRTDASILIGSGHVMRCLTLAEALQELGFEVEFVCRRHRGNLIDLIDSKGFEVHALPEPKAKEKSITAKTGSRLEHIINLGVSQEQDAEETRSVLKEKFPYWIIVDQYGLDLKWETHLRPHVRKIMVIDDLADRSHDCDILLDQNLRVDASRRYRSLVPEHCCLLLGPNHVLLRPEFHNVDLRDLKDGVKSVLIYFGGNDFNNQVGRAVEALTHFPQLNVSVILGHSHPHQKALMAIGSRHKHINLSNTTQDMADLMRKHDLAFGTCGTAAWERCAIGLPTLVTISAENQREDAIALNKLGAVELIGEAQHVGASEWITALNQILINSNLVSRMQLAAQKVVTGHIENKADLLRRLTNEV